MQMITDNQTSNSLRTGGRLTSPPMMTDTAINSTLAFQPDLDPVADWVVVIVYDDARAGRRAVITLDAVVHQLGGTTRPLPRLWRFDLLEDPDWRAAATHDVAQADLFIISASDRAALPTTVQRWVEGSLDQSRGTPNAVVALLGPEDDTDAPDSPRVQLLRRAVEAAELSFFAPATRLDCPLNAPAVAPPAPPRPAGSAARRILLVEDDASFRELGARVLMDAGYHVDVVPGSQFGWAALQTHTYDLLITDNQMPEMSGLEMVRKLRSAKMALPVIMASGGVGEEDLIQNPWLQPATVLPKPYHGDALLERVSEVLSLADRIPGRSALALRETGNAPEHWSQPDHWYHGGLND